MGDSRWAVESDATVDAFGATDAAAAPEPSSAVPTPLGGRYQLAASLGRGGHGEVFRAADLVGGGEVAVKLLHQPHGAPLERMRREVSALQLLRLPGVVRLLDQGTAGTRPFIVMELIEGSPFPGAGSDRSWAALAGRVFSLLEVLAQVHAAGVVHRDLKPSNVLVTLQGVVTILDFGVAWAPVGDPTLTPAGALVGTPAYWAPELLQGERASAAADLYAFGVMLYQALCGELPYPAASYEQLLLAKLTGRMEPIERLAPATPRTIREVLPRLLARRPQDRPRTATEVRALLGGAPGGLLRSAVLPRLGGDGPVRRLVRAARDGESCDVWGAAGTGRSRLLQDASVALEQDGFAVVWMLPGTSPFFGLSRLFGDLEQAHREPLTALTERVQALLRARLAGRTVILADDEANLDRWTAASLARCRDAGRVFRVVTAPSDGDGVELRPLTVEQMQLLFHGPDRLHHLREDAAAELLRRTEGVQALVADEVNSWVRAGVADWDGPRLRLSRRNLDRLRAGVRVSPAGLGARALGGPLDAYLEEILAWMSLAWPHADAAFLERVSGLPRWRLEAGIEELVRLGAARRRPEGRFEATAPPSALQDWTGEKRAAAHRAVAAGLSAGSDGRLYHLVAGGLAHEVTQEACVLARRLTDDGRLGEAEAVLLEALVRLRTTGAQGEHELLAHLVGAALARESPGALRRVTYELGRARCRDQRTLELESVVISAELAFRGDGTAALARLRETAPFEDDALEARRLAIHVRAAARESLECHATVLQEIETAVSQRPSAARQSSLANWRGWLRYRQGAYSEAAELHRAAAAHKSTVTGRLSAMLNAASALQEAFRYEESAEMARTAFDLAAQVRHPLYEARAAWLLRSIAYRTATATEIDGDLIEALDGLDAPQVEGQILLTEAAVAWRAAASDSAAALARRAVERFDAARSVAGAVLSRALARRVGAEMDWESVWTRCRDAVDSTMPRIGVQVRGLLAASAGRRCQELHEEASTLAACVATDQWARRLEVLSISEAIEQTAGRR